MSQSPGRNATHCPGRLLQPTVLRIPLRGTRARRSPLTLGDLCQPSGLNGEGLAKGQAQTRAANLL